MSRPETNAITGFTEDQASRLTGVSLRQLRYWSRDGFFTPSIDMGALGGPDLRLYSFRDLACLKVISTLRNEVGSSLQHLRDVKKRLSRLGDDLWSKTTLRVLGKRVVFVNPETGGNEDAATGQGVLQIPLQVVTGNIETAVREMRQRQPADLGRIDLKKSGAKHPVIAGTRIPVRTIQDLAADGMSVEEIVAQFPSLSATDVEAALRHRLAA